MGAENGTFPEDGTADVEGLILNLPADQARAVADVLGLVAGQVEAARDVYRHDPSPRWSGLSEAASIVGSVAAYAEGVAR